MITIRQIERAWTARTYEKLFRELVANRPEASFRFEHEQGRGHPRRRHGGHPARRAEPVPRPASAAKLSAPSSPARKPTAAGATS